MGQPAAPVGLTVAASIDDGAAALQAAGIESARREARWLLGHVLGAHESNLLAHGDDLVAPEAAARYAALIQRRAGHEPFAYLVSQREFYGRTFVVDRRVLIPRPETETLIEAVIAAGDGTPMKTPLVVDVGTGSGAIACTLALERPAWRMIGSDLSADALTVATINRHRLGLDGRLAFVQGSLLDWLGRRVDIVVANLPYIPSSRVAELMPEVSQWEPTLALDGGRDGTYLMRRLLYDAMRTVRPGGTILLELDPGQPEMLATVVSGARTTVIRDLAGLDRALRVDVP
jgi:release factor glutamine methyltransferase